MRERGKNGVTEMGEDLIDMICRDLGYDERRKREMRLLQMLAEGGWTSGTDERIAWVRSLSDRALNGISVGINIGRANYRIQKTWDTLGEKLGYPVEGAYTHAIDGRDLSEGVLHRLNDSRGREAFKDVFNSEFWSRPQGTDRTLKDINKLLPPGHQLEGSEFAHFGTPIKEEEKPPGVV